MQLRRIQESELSALRALRVQAAQWLQSKGIAQWNPEGFTEQHTRTDFAQHALYGLWDGEVLVGSFRLQESDPEIWPEALPGEALYLHCLVVARSRAGEGWGGYLLNQAMSLVASAGVTFLRLDCWDRNETLRQYYTSQGFTRCGEVGESGWKVTRFEKARQV